MSIVKLSYDLNDTNNTGVDKYFAEAYNKGRENFLSKRTKLNKITTKQALISLGLISALGGGFSYVNHKRKRR